MNADVLECIWAYIDEWCCLPLQYYQCTASDVCVCVISCCSYVCLSVCLSVCLFVSVVFLFILCRVLNYCQETVLSYWLQQIWPWRQYLPLCQQALIQNFFSYLIKSIRGSFFICRLKTFLFGVRTLHRLRSLAVFYSVVLQERPSCQ